jgi:menaquinone-9 beta-reductase
LNNEFDVGIIGASIGGASAAHVLGGSGRSVLLIDKALFPRPKPCGEGLSSAGVRLAHRLGVWTPELSHLVLRGFKISTGERWYPFDIKGGGGVSLERTRFDHHLLTLARQHPSVATEEGGRASVWRQPNGFRVEVGGRQYSVSKLILADGTRSPVAQSLGLLNDRPEKSRQRNAAATHFSGHFGSLPDMVHILVGPSYELYATPLPGNRLNVAALVQASSALNPRDLLLDDQVLRPLLQEMRFEGLRDAAVLGRSGVESFRPHHIPPGIFLVGDAREQFDPIGGMGMTHALMSAELAARSIVEERDNRRAIRRFERARGVTSRRLRRFTYLTHSLLQSSRRVELVLPVMSSRLGSALASCFVPSI